MTIYIIIIIYNNIFFIIINVHKMELSFFFYGVGLMRINDTELRVVNIIWLYYYYYYVIVVIYAMIKHVILC